MSTYVNVHGKIVDAAGIPIFRACVAFIPTVGSLYDSVADATVACRSVITYTALDGSFEAALQATDDTGVTPHTGWSYTVRESVRGRLPFVWAGLAVPVADVTAGLDYNAARPTG